MTGVAVVLMCILACAQTALEDSTATMATVLSSRFVAGIRSEVEKAEATLRLFAGTLDEWLAVQKM